MIVRLFEMIKSSRPFQDACHIVAEPSTLQLPMWQEMHKGLLCRSRRVHPTTNIVARNAQRVTEPLPTNTVSFLGRPTVLPGQPTTIFPLAIQIKCENVSKELVLIGYPCWHWCHMKFSIINRVSSLYHYQCGKKCAKVFCVLSDLFTLQVHCSMKCAEGHSTIAGQHCVLP